MLQTQTFNSDKTSNGFTLQLTVTEESTDTLANTSTVSYQLRLLSETHRFSTYSIGWSVSLAGTVVNEMARASAPQQSIGTNSSLTLCTGQTTVKHDVDGTKTMGAAFSIDMAKTSYTPGPISVTGKSMPLTFIARASGIGAADADIGAASIIAVNKKNTAYTHSIAYRFGSLSGYITEDGKTSAQEVRFGNNSVSFPIPTAFYGQIPNAPSGVCALTCRTYSGNTQIGDPQSCAFTVTARQSICQPEVTGTVVDSNEVTKALTGDENVLIRYCSTANCAISATAKNGAAIVSKSIAGTAVSGNSRSIENVETDSFLFSATDSRGYSKSEPVTKTLIDYIPLTCKASARRKEPTTGAAVISLSGKYFAESFGASDNSLTVSYRVKPEGGSYGDPAAAAAVIDGNSWSAAAEVTGLTYTDAWVIEVTAADKLTTVTKELNISRGIPAFDWGEDNFNFNVSVTGPVRGLAKLPWIKKDADVNDYRTPGVYGITNNDIAKSVKNLPAQKAGTLLVYVSNGAHAAGRYTYLVQEYRAYDATGIYLRFVYTEASADVWQYSDWKQICPQADFVAQQGSSGIWTYRKWNSGIAECWGTVTVASVAYTSQWGNLVTGNKAMTSQTYPFSFTERPREVVTLHNTSSTACAMPENPKVNTQSKTAGYVGVRNSGEISTLSTDYYDIYVTGKWK